LQADVPLNAVRISAFALTALVAASACQTEDTVVLVHNRHPNAGGSAGVDGGPPRVGGASGTVNTTQEAGPLEGVKRVIPPDLGARQDGATGVTIGGSLKIASNLFLDGDPGDEAQFVASNDSLATAQLVGSPATVGGYLNPANSRHDTTDVYTMDLANGEVVALYIALPSDASAAPDFDLDLYDASDNVIDSSTGTGRVEAVTAPGTGTYRVAVSSAHGGSGIYTLAAGASLSTFAAQDALRDKLSAGWPLVPGEALVKLRPGANVVGDPWARLGVRPLSSGVNAIGYRRVVFDSLRRSNVLQTATAYDARSTIDAIKRLRAHPTVEFAEPNYIRKAHAPAPNDPLYPVQWHYPLVSLVSAWDHSTGAGTTVAVLDCGIRKDHPDFVNADSSSQLLDGYDMIADETISADGDGRDADATDPGDRLLANDSSWHGTHVSGTVAAATNNGVGCAGVSPATKILPVRVLGIGGGTTDDLVQAILYSAGLQNDTGVLPARRADVINMSLGGQGRSRATAGAVEAARAAGAFVVASAGNETADASAYSPAAEPGVVTVGAVDMMKALAWYSNFGSAIDVVAPGGDETVDLNGNGVKDGVMSLVEAAGGRKLYAPYQGTSMAAPHVSGIIALMKAAYPVLTPTLFDSMLAGTAGVGRITEDLGPAGRDDSFGFGLLNANLAVLGALEAASAPVTTTPTLLLSPTTLDFGALDTTLNLIVSNAGRGTLTVSSFQVDQPWVTVTPRVVGANTVTVDRTSLGPGLHTSLISIVSNGGTGSVTVRLNVPSSNVVTGGDIGTIYVLAIDTRTEQTVGEAQAKAAGGYAFEIRNLPKGSYRIVAGTDFDNNGFIGDDGEAYGAYPITSEPRIIDASNDVSGVLFPVTYLYGIQIASMSNAAASRRVKRPGR
jgi:serine protease